MSDRKEQSCAVCARKLNHVETPDGREMWVHTSEEDHLAVPVPEDEVETLYACDFCYRIPADYCLPVESFDVPVLDLGNNLHVTTNTGMDWAICWTCAALVESNEWRSLLVRTVRSWKAVNGSPISMEGRVRLWEFYGQVRAHITGRVRER